jgi:hypothetical protein
MRFRLSISVLCGLFAVVSAVGAQTVSWNDPPIIGFVDLAGVPGAHQITITGGNSVFGIPFSTIGNALFPPALRTMAVDGVVYGSSPLPVSATNAPIPPAPANPSGIPASASGILAPFWDDLHPAAASQMWWHEDLANGVLYFMWKDINHAPSTTFDEGITFEIQVFRNGGGTNCPHVIQFLYLDTWFGGSQNANNGGTSATVGYAHGAIAGIGNYQWSFNAFALLNCLTFSYTEPPVPFALVPSSPSGAGSLKIELVGAPCGVTQYYIAATLVPGAYPNGWLYGLDIPVADAIAQYTSGAPFVGYTSASGKATIGPFTGLPTPLTFYAVGLTIAPGPTITGHTAPITFTL